MGKITQEDRIVIKALLVFIMKKLLKICITPLLVVCSLHVPKSLNFTYTFKCYHQKCKLASL